MYRTPKPKLRVNKACLEAVQALLTRFSISEVRTALEVLNPPLEALEGPYGRVLL